MKKIFGMMTLLLTGAIVQASDMYFGLDMVPARRQLLLSSAAPSAELVRFGQPMARYGSGAIAIPTRYGSGALTATPRYETGGGDVALSALAQQLFQQVEQLRVIAQRNGGLVTFTVDQTTLDKMAMVLGGGNTSLRAGMTADGRYGGLFGDLVNGFGGLASGIAGLFDQDVARGIQQGLQITKPLVNVVDGLNPLSFVL